MADDDPFADDKTVLRPGGRKSTGGGGNAPPAPEDDKTVMRPRPGGRASRPGAPASAPREPTAQRQTQQRPAPRRAEAAAPAEIRGSGLNPLVNAATTLLVLVAQLRGTARNPDVAALRSRVVQELKQFDAAAREAGLPNETVLSARYTLCTVMDETVLATPWGSESPWARQTLLSAFHKETWGGEKVFQILEHMLSAPARNIEYLELMYICLALGFEGKYRVLEHGRRQLEQIQENLFRAIRSQRPDFERELSPHWRGVVDKRGALVRYVPLWVVAALAAALLAALYVGFRFMLSDAADPAFSRLQQIGRGEPPIVEIAIAQPAVPAPPPPPKARTVSLREFLAPEVQQGLVDVTEADGRTTVVVRGDGLFGSGSVDVKSDILPLLERTAEALNEVPGRVLVTGHTDSVPIRTVRFPSNWHLSQARAEAVSEVLARTLADPERLTAEGRADTEPLAANDTPENRARNRRVEIILITQGAAQ